MGQAAGPPGRTHQPPSPGTDAASAPTQTGTVCTRFWADQGLILQMGLLGPWGGAGGQPVGCNTELDAKLGLKAAAGVEGMWVGCCSPGLCFPSWTTGGSWIKLPHKAGARGESPGWSQSLRAS